MKYVYVVKSTNWWVTVVDQLHIHTNNKAQGNKLLLTSLQFLKLFAQQLPTET